MNYEDIVAPSPKVFYRATPPTKEEFILRMQTPFYRRKKVLSTIFCIFLPPRRPIPAKAGISAAAKRREIVHLYAFGDSLRLSARRFLPSQEWDVSFRPENVQIAPEQGENGEFSVNRGGETQKTEFRAAPSVFFTYFPKADDGRIRR